MDDDNDNAFTSNSWVTILSANKWCDDIISGDTAHCTGAVMMTVWCDDDCVMWWWLCDVMMTVWCDNDCAGDETGAFFMTVWLLRLVKKRKMSQKNFAHSKAGSVGS